MKPSLARAPEVVIFGASSNTGRYLVSRFLELGWHVLGVGRRQVSAREEGYTYHQGDIRNLELFEGLPKNPDAVINLAGIQPSISTSDENTDFAKHLDEYLSTNIAGLGNVLSYVQRSRPDVYIFASSHREIENHWKNGEALPNELPISINMEGDHALYAITKAAGRLLGEFLQPRSGVRVFTLQLPMLYSVPDNPYYLVEGKPQVLPFIRIINQARLGQPLEIWGDPLLRRDYVHMENFLQMVLLCIDGTERRGTFVVGTGEGVTTESFIKAIAAEFGHHDKENSLIYRPEKKTFKCASYDISDQISLLGYRPVLLKEMLQKIHSEILEKDTLRKLEESK